MKFGDNRIPDASIVKINSIVKILVLFITSLLNVHVFGQQSEELYIDELNDSTVFKEVESILVDGAFFSNKDKSILLAKKCGNLKRLHVSGMKHLPFGENLCSFHNLISLRIENIQNVSFPHCFTLNNTLDSLVIITSNQKNLLLEVHKIPSLQCLALIDTRITTSQLEQLRELKKLKVLRLGSNRITSSFSLGYFTSIEHLSLDNNLLQSFNLSDTLYSLTALSISGNKIKNYSGLLKAPNIIKLNLSDNKMVAVPLEVGNSKNLLDLDLSHNKITNYDKLAYLKKLRTLSLSNNFLEKIPTSLSSVNTIAKLDISFNKELNIDSTLNQLIAYFGVLEELNVSYCELSHIPSIISELKHLKRIIISGNKLSKQAIDELQRNIPICEIVNLNIISGIPKYPN